LDGHPEQRRRDRVFKMNGLYCLYPSEDMAAGAGIKNDGAGQKISITIYYPTEKEVTSCLKILPQKA